MDRLFKSLLANDYKFKNEWLKTPYLYCEKKGSSHTLANYNFGMTNNTKSVKKILEQKPPYVLKLSSRLEEIYPNLNSKSFYNSNAFFAIKMSTRKLEYFHQFESPSMVSSPTERNFFIRSILKISRKILQLIS